MEGAGVLSVDEVGESLLRPAVRDANGRFRNPVPTEMVGGTKMLRLLPKLWFGREEREPKVTPGPFKTDTGIYAVAPASGLRVTWFGHSSSLVEMDGMRVLIDPVWDERASPMRWAGPKRFFPPTCALEELPVPDAVLLSHDHYDHLGAATVRRLAAMPAWRDVRWITSEGVGALLRKFGVRAAQITEMNWTEQTEVVGRAGARLRVDCWPARHFSGRSLFNRSKTLWSSWVLEGARHRVYFGADSGAWPVFGEIAARYRDGFDLTMLEIGAFNEAWGNIHLGPDAAAEAFCVMRAAGAGPAELGLMMPIHWGLFNLALHPWRQPMERLEELAREKGLRLWSPRPGVPTVVTGPAVDGWWRA